MNEHAKYLEHVLHYLDEDGDGKISAAELKKRVGLMGGDPLLLGEAVESLDSDGDGLLGLDDLARLMETGGGDEERVNDLRVAFRMYIDDDVDEDLLGATELIITPRSLKRMLSRLGESRSVDQCKVMIDCFDLNGDGVINFEEFRVMMME